MKKSNEYIRGSSKQSELPNVGMKSYGDSSLSKMISPVEIADNQRIISV